MPRCTISVSPRSRSASRYFDRRRSAVDPRAGQPLAPGAAGTASAGPGAAPRRASITRPASTGSRPRRTVSTSGSSGIAPPRARARGCSAPDLPYKERRKPTESPPCQPTPEPTTHFGYETVPEAEKAGAGPRRLPLGRRPLRPDERRDEPRHPPAVEGRDARLAGAPARHAAARRRRRHRRHRLPLPAAGEGPRPCHRARHDRGHARARAAGAPRRPSFAAALDWVVGRRDGAALRGRRASTPTRSPSASATSPASRTRSPRRSACCGPAGRLMVLEFSRVPEPSLRWLYDRYSFNVIPPLGQALAGDRASYQYLVESIRRFPDQESFAGDDRRRRLRPGALPQPLDGHRRAALGLEALTGDARPAQPLAPDPHRRHLRAHRRDARPRWRPSTRRRRCASPRACSAGRSSGSATPAIRRSRRSCGR